MFVVIDDLRARGVAVLYISHKLSDPRRIADRVVVLRDRRVVGSYLKPIDLADAVQAMTGHGVGRSNGPRATERDQAVLRISAARLRTDSATFDFVAHTGEVVAVTGPVGAGKSSLAGAIFGRWPPAGWSSMASRGAQEAPANRSSARRLHGGGRPLAHDLFPSSVPFDQSRALCFSVDCEPRASCLAAPKRARRARSSRAAQFQRFTGSCAGGSSISANGFSRNSASSSPSRFEPRAAQDGLSQALGSPWPSRTGERRN
jgi:hypothetical protein